MTVLHLSRQDLDREFLKFQISDLKFQMEEAEQGKRRGKKKRKKREEKRGKRDSSLRSE